ncbi:SDR family NAD(P)-dependent oxidoreductase [Kutzneria albida]|uniref:Short-chain alcohol dehydrogenase n=1 Tax=Kutzneria albida DSM 43870 TaxID=1449976 RepID=W5VZL8_9PSEU|nr:SDR family NAD(P)-dependent oxidoreductase [Kutzneria albida]AHH94022.1 short-chain alcohol dehydrogenase [Kutzneria albida DSM 43870]
MTNSRLRDKVALVTGASSGIGEATAESLAAEGASVVLAARRTDRLESLRQRLEEKGAQVLAVTLDVADERSCTEAVAATVDRFGRLDVLVNNAGVMLLGPIHQADTSDWTRMVNTNLLGSMFMAHAALPHLLDTRGTIVQVSSVAGRVARSGSGGYNATKWGINAFCESLRQEVTERGVRVVLVEPGAVDTELREHITNEAAKQAIDQFVTQIRQLRSADIANAVVYAATQPEHVAVNEILIRPTDQAR